MNHEPISPIKVSSNGRYFVDPSGKPVFWLGDTQWELFRLFPTDIARRILRDRQAKGFNIILVMLTGVDMRQLFPDRQSSFANLAGDLPWIDGDPLLPNERYFEHVDTLIRLGEETGQTFVVGVYHKWHADLFPLEKARPWARCVAQRYHDVPNLIWSMYPTASESFMPICRELAAGLQEGDGGNHLICVHPDPAVASSSFLHQESWLAFNMIQTCIEYDRIYESVTADYQRQPAKPAIMAEGGYEGVEFDKFQTAHHIRKQAFWTQLAGGHHVYGHNDAWSAPERWETWLDAPGSKHLRVFKDILVSLDTWWALIPDQGIFASGMGSGYALNAAARAAGGDWGLAYLSEPGNVSIHLRALSARQQACATWIDPRNGNRQPAISFPTQDPVNFTTPPGWEDALLLLEADKGTSF